MFKKRRATKRDRKERERRLLASLEEQRIRVRSCSCWAEFWMSSSSSFPRYFKVRY